MLEIYKYCRMSRALRQTARIAATECACALRCFDLAAGDSLTSDCTELDNSEPLLNSKINVL